MFPKSFILDLIFPSRCLFCLTVGVADRLCAACRGKIPFLNGPHCPRCAQPFSSDTTAFHLCGRCLEEPPAFDRVIPFGLYDGILLDLVGRIKYRRDEKAAFHLGKWLGEKIEGIESEVVVPIPLHPRRLRERGFNQAAILARGIAGKKPLSLFDLERIRDTPTQTGLSIGERRQNVKGAFRIVRNFFEGKKIILVDDVLTTGATASECAKVLRKGGAVEVTVAVMGRTP